MKKQVDIAIIGAGTAGLSAFKEASKETNNILLIDHGPLGTTCARVGCMPSKLFIQAADFYHSRLLFSERGIQHADKLKVDFKAVMRYVRKLRDDFTSGVIHYIESIGDAFIKESAQFIGPQTLKAGNQEISAKKIIIATGAHPNIPSAWKNFQEKILTEENFFEQETFDQSIIVIGAGVMGLELGQALHHLGIDITMFHAHEHIAHITDPVVNHYAVDIMQSEFPLYLNHRADVQKKNKKLLVQSKNKKMETELLLAALGKIPNLEQLHLKETGISLNEKNRLDFNNETMQIKNHPVFIAGDVDKNRPFLHEAADDGTIAGYNASHNIYCFKRKVPLTIIFTKPNIALVGQTFASLKDKNFIIGEIDFSDQGRARILGQNQGVLRIYADPETCLFLGAEMIAPCGEHLAHLLAWLIQNKITVLDALQLPFYHPTVEEGVRTALRQLVNQIVPKKSYPKGFALCDNEVMKNLS